MTCTYLTLKLAKLWTLPVITLHISCNQHLQNWQRVELLPTPFPCTKQENLSSSITFPTFSLLITIFIFLTFTLDPFDSYTPFQASSLPFRPPHVSLKPSHQLLLTLVNNKGLNTEPLCNPTCTSKLSLKVSATLAWLQAFLYIWLYNLNQPLFYA